MSLDHLPRRELEMLSAYLDGELKPKQARKLEARLAYEPQLQDALRDLQAVKRGLRDLPDVDLPRSFTLTAEMVGAPRSIASYPVLRLATALAAFVFVAVVGVDLFSGSLSGAMMARSMDQIAAEAPAPAEAELADAAKSELQEGEFELELFAEEMPAEADSPGEETTGEGMALAEPAAEDEAAVEERSLGESEAPAEPEALAPQMTPQLEDEAAMAYSATVLPETDTPLNQIVPDEPSMDEPPGIPERRTSPAMFWLRGIEIGLGLLTLTLGALTLWARRRSQ